MGAIAVGFLHMLGGVWQVLALVALLLPAALVRAVPGARQGPRLRTATAQAMHSGSSRPGVPAAVLGRQRVVWQSACGWRSVLRDAAKLGLALTAASLLSLAATVVARQALPPDWLECLVAGVLLWVALSNLLPVAAAQRWKLALPIGVVQGLGCAAALRTMEAGCPVGAVPWLGFVLGLGLAQWAVLLLMVPLAWRLRRNAVYRGWVFRGGSLLIALLAAGWLVQALLRPLWLPVLAGI